MFLLLVVYNVVGLDWATMYEYVIRGWKINSVAFDSYGVLNLQKLD